MTDQQRPTIQPPPAGLRRRREVRAWNRIQRAQQREWDRAQGQAAAEQMGPVPVLRAPITGRDRSSRRQRAAWHEAHTEALHIRNRAYVREVSTRQVGALVVVGCFALILPLRVFLFSTDDSPGIAVAAPTTTAASPVAAPQVSRPAPTTTAAPAGSLPAVDLAERWFTVTCPLTPDAWLPAADLMTREAYAVAATTPPPVVVATWYCTDIAGEPVSGVRADGSMLVRLTAQRTVTPRGASTFTEPVSEVRIVTPDGQGGFVVGLPPEH